MSVITEVADCDQMEPCITVRSSRVCAASTQVSIETDEGTRHEYSVPRNVHVNMQEGEHVRTGDPLIDGPLRC